MTVLQRLRRLRPWRPFRLRNDLYCIEWGVKLYSLIHPWRPSALDSFKASLYTAEADPKIFEKGAGPPPPPLPFSLSFPSSSLFLSLRSRAP